MAYLHGAYGEITPSKVKKVTQSDVVVGYIGVAPVNLIRDFANLSLVNMPIKVSNMSDAQNKFGYSDNWNDFTLCEAFAEHFDNTIQTIGPIYCVNVLDPAIHKKGSNTTKSLVFANHRCEFESDTIILDTFAIADKVEGVDYTLSYNFAKKTVVVKLLTGAAAQTLNASYREIDLNAIDSATIIGSKTSAGAYTGLYSFELLYQYYNAVLSVLVAPKWSEKAAVYNAMVNTVTKLNGHWDGFALADIPVEDAKIKEVTVASHAATIESGNLIDGSVEVWKSDGSAQGALTTDYTLSYSSGTLTISLVSAGALYSEAKLLVKYKESVETIEDAIAWKAANGYIAENSKALWPQIKDSQERIFHLSTVCAATMLAVDQEHEGVPFESPSNKPIMATMQYFGANSASKGFDQETANSLNEKGITTAVFWSGRWVLWGPHTAAFTYNGNMDARAIFDATLRTLMYITNSFQLDHGIEIDKPMTPQDRDSIMNAESAKLDRLKAIGALVGEPEVLFVESENPVGNMVNGDFVWHFNVTNTPLFKSGTARVTYTDEGFEAFFN